MAIFVSSLNDFFVAKCKSFYKTKKSAAAVEFALSSLALFLFLLAIVNIGLLGFSISAMEHGVQAAARHAAVDAAHSYETSTSPKSFSCDSASTIATYFDGYADPPLPTAGTATTDNPYISATWTNNTGTTPLTTEPPGEYLKLTATYRWSAIGFPARFGSITLKYTTVATVMGTTTGSPTMNSPC
ncbi:MAG TPA: TadE/TadG family type IV pilus assembly protein [Acidocella sp.]|nr:TadE/TadG family type IV pilus assembly protein [Acidocella sp.]